MSTPDAIAPEVYRQFSGFEKLTGFFGYWPGFHDAEILFLRMGLDPSLRGSPMIALALHTFDWDQELDSGKTITTHHCTVILYFSQVADVHLTGLNERNIISELRLDLDGREKPPRIIVAFPAINGLDGHFTCDTVEVCALNPGIPPGSMYEK